MTKASVSAHEAPQTELRHAKLPHLDLDVLDYELGRLIELQQALVSAMLRSLQCAASCQHTQTHLLVAPGRLVGREHVAHLIV